jgi:hypothetical protein
MGDVPTRLGVEVPVPLSATISGIFRVRFGVVPPLDIIGADAVTAVMPLFVIVSFGHEPESEMPLPATSPGDVVPVPPYEIESGVESPRIGFVVVPLLVIGGLTDVLPPPPPPLRVMKLPDASIVMT